MKKMADMKMTKADMSGMGMVSSSGDYPYGLEISLEASSVKKLNLAEVPEAGEEVMIHACCVVSRVSATGNGDKSMSLQITKMAMMSEEEADKDSDDAAWSKAKSARKEIYG